MQAILAVAATVRAWWLQVAVTTSPFLSAANCGQGLERTLLTGASLFLVGLESTLPFIWGIKVEVQGAGQ